MHFRRDIILHFLTNNIAVTIIAPKPEQNIDNWIPFVDYRLVKMNRVSKGLFDNIIYLYQLFINIYIIKPNIIVQYTIKPILFGNIIASILRIQTLSIFAGLGDVFSKKTLFNKCIINVLKHAISHSRKIFVLNETDERFLIDRKIVVKDKLFRLNGGEGVDTNKYCPSNIKKNHLEYVF